MALSSNSSSFLRCRWKKMSDANADECGMSLMRLSDRIVVFTVDGV